MAKRKNEVLRYLGYAGAKVDPLTERCIRESLSEIDRLKQEKSVYKFFGLGRADGGLKLIGSTLELKNGDITEHLRESTSCVLMALTLGHRVDNRISYCERTDLTKAVILNACAAAAIEELCDQLCSDLSRKLARDGKCLTARFSPGYGDFPLHVQKQFLSILDAERAIGLTATSRSILIPRKSVTAIAGIVDHNAAGKTAGCLSCSKYPECKFRKVGGHSGN